MGEKMIDLSTQLKARKGELDRINATLKIDDNRIKFLQIAQEKQSESQKITHLESQIDVLQSELIENEANVKEIEQKNKAIEKLKSENADLDEKLDITWAEMDKLKLSLTSFKTNSKALQLEKKFDILKSTKKLSKNVNELQAMQNRIDELTKLNKVLETKLATKSKQHSIIKNKNKSEKSSNHTMAMRLELKEKELDKVRQEQVDLMRVADELQQLIKDLMHEMEMNSNDKTNMQMSLKSAENKLAILTKENSAMNEKYESMKNLNSSNQESNKQMNGENESLKFKIKCLEKENSAMNDRLARVMDQKNDFETKDTAKQSENFELVKKLQHVEFKNEDLQKEKEWNASLLQQAQTKLSKLEKDKKELQQCVERTKTHLDELQRKYNEIEYKFHAVTKKANDLEDKLKQSEAMICSLKVVKNELDLNEKDKNGLELKLISLTNENDKLAKECKIASNDNKRKQDVIDRIDSEKNSLKLILQQLQQQMGAFQQRLSAVTADRDHIKKLYDASSAEMDLRNEKIQNTNLNLSDLKNEYAKTQSALKNLRHKHEELSNLYANKENLCRDSSNKINEFSSIQDQMAKQLKQQIDEKQQIQVEVRQLSKERDAQMDALHELTAQYNDLKENVVPRLNQELVASQLKTGELKVLFLIGTKFDLFDELEDHLKKDITKQARKFAKKMHAPLIYCSSAQSINVKKIFKVIIAKVFDLKPKIKEAHDATKDALIEFERNGDDNVDGDGDGDDEENEKDKKHKDKKKKRDKDKKRKKKKKKDKERKSKKKRRKKKKKEGEDESDASDDDSKED